MIEPLEFRLFSAIKIYKSEHAAQVRKAVFSCAACDLAKVSKARQGGLGGLLRH
jgi:hypothetical protein